MLVSFSHPDYTVGPGFTPGQPAEVALKHGSRTNFGVDQFDLLLLKITAGGELHPAPKDICN
jgi:hypothetical protein